MKAVVRIAPLVVAALFAAPSAYALADNPPTPLTANGVQVNSVEQGRHLLGAARFFDQRLPIKYGKGHIPGAIALQYVPKSARSEGFDPSNDKFDMTKLPGDKSSPIVFYSGGPNGWRAYKAAIVASR